MYAPGENGDYTMKILVNIHIPAISKQYDVLVPSKLRIRSILPLIASAVAELSGHVYVVSGEECLCALEKDVLLRPNATLEQYGIRNGDHLVMM